MRPDTVTKAVKHTFDNGELLTMADAITESVQRLGEVKRAKADADKLRSKDEMEQQTGTITKLSGMYRRGYEFRDVDCKVLYNSPEVGEKTFVRIDTGEEVSTDNMTEEEKQETLPLANAAVATSEAGDA
jgi:hypothetical protein